MIAVNVVELRRFGEHSFQAVGLNQKDSACVTDVLVEADLRGVHSHGVQNLPRYARGCLKGHISRSVSCPLVLDAGATSVMDGENGLGPVCCNKAMDVAIERASKYGLALVSVRNSNHFGVTAYYSMKALKHDYIGFCTTNGPAVIAPWGGSEPLLSSNPFSCAIPAGTEPPIVLDMSCGMVAHTRIRLKARDNLPIPEGWAITKSGEPTTDPREALEGTVLPVGGYKGYGIAVIDEVLSSCLTGALFSFEILQGMVGIDWKRSDFPQPSFRCGHLVVALDPGKLVPVEEFKRRVDRLCVTLKASAKAKGFERIYLPGEIEQELRTERLGSGIPMSESTIDMLNSFAKEIGIEGVKSA